MKRSLNVVRCAAVLLLLPFFCVSRNTAITGPVPFPAQAIAGHTFPDGRSCQCGDNSCICSPGEMPVNVTATSRQSNSAVSNRESNRQPLAPVSQPGLAALVLALLVTVLLRMR